MSGGIRFEPSTDPRIEEDCQCARCGSSCFFERCEMCRDGEVEHDSWDGCGPSYFTRCEWCRGVGGYYLCCSGAEWCEAHPFAGRENIPCGKIEWFTINEISAPHPSEKPSVIGMDENSGVGGVEE